ncbi:hypothetical protein [Mycobacterium sp. AZCC_0083]|uniref:hypothetical protein n=1 Tax=Mycobacterium sp. AZCC_0083 TaxID=2735882 RepID=UPI00160C5EEE|nr:hypothetical protein [Mycobacterium sp. AZCC_0083]MBB5166975.1 hypothetical protein [Mycobacterium sp. AZCC_0083]
MPAVSGITTQSLRALMTGLLGGMTYTMNQASYDLARLRTNGLIARIPGKNRYRRPGPTGTKRLPHHRHSHDRNHRPGPTAAQASLKTQDNCQKNLATKVR